MPFTCCFEASNYPIFHSWPVCYPYVLLVCHLHAGSKLRTTQSSIPGQYAIYTYCQYAIYMLLRSFEPPNLRFPASMLSIRIASMLFTCYFEPPNLPSLASMLSIRIASILFTCCFEASNHPIFHSWPVCYLYVLPTCYLQCHAISELRTTESSIPGQYAIYTYCQYAIYTLLRSFEVPNLPFPASMLSIRIASMLRTTQSYIPGQYAIYTYCQYAIYMLSRSFEPPNLPFPASMLSSYTYCQYAIYMLLRTTQWMDTLILPVWQSVTKSPKLMYCMCTVRRPAHCHHVMYVDNS